MERDVSPQLGESACGSPFCFENDCLARTNAPNGPVDPVNSGPAAVTDTQKEGSTAEARGRRWHLKEEIEDVNSDLL